MLSKVGIFLFAFLALISSCQASSQLGEDDPEWRNRPFNTDGLFLKRIAEGEFQESSDNFFNTSKCTAALTGIMALAKLCGLSENNWYWIVPAVITVASYLYSRRLKNNIDHLSAQQTYLLISALAPAARKGYLTPPKAAPARAIHERSSH